MAPRSCAERAVAFECHRAAAVLGAAAYWLVAHGLAKRALGAPIEDEPLRRHRTLFLTVHGDRFQVPRVKASAAAEVIAAVRVVARKLY
jgi:hypothetical protein